MEWERGMDEEARTLPEATCGLFVGGANDFVQSECKKEAGIAARRRESTCRRRRARDGHIFRALRSAGLPLKLLETAGRRNSLESGGE